MPTVPMSPDGPAHPNETCLSCHGVATKLRFRAHPYGLVGHSGVYICEDAKLCGLTLVYEMMLSTVRSAL
jgi:hypothetical protein